MEKLNIILNGKAITGNPGETILQLSGRHGIKIPSLCNDRRLVPFSSCYVCVVDVEGYRGLQPACSTTIAEGMVINTDNDKVRKARKTALDLMVSNHFADCEAPCKQTCPAGVDVQGYISLIEKNLYSEAVALIKEVNPLSAICGRVCVRPCEVACRRNFLDEGSAVGIDYLKRYASDRDLESDHSYLPVVEKTTGKKVAIIGSGPGGLSAAWFLQIKGHKCDIFEAAPHAGGWLRYGIPEYRLPNDILQKEVDAITRLGVDIYFNRRLGSDLSYSELKTRYDAVILAIGSQRGTLLGCSGEDAEGVFSGIDFLRNMEMTGQRYDFKGKKVAVVGGGNTAMDCCRTSLRCGADKVYVIYRRTEKEMPANPIEIHESRVEGAEYMFLTNPVSVNKDENGAVKSVTCIKMELGEPDASGRRRPVPVEGSEFHLELDYILAAIGQKTDVDFLDDINNNSSRGKLEINKWGDISADPGTLQTGIESVFAAGDGVTGPATIIEAIAQARIAARSCHQYLSDVPLEPEQPEFISRKDNFREITADMYKDRYREQLRHEMPTLDPADRNDFDEVELGYENEEVAVRETTRCLECGCSEYYTCDLKQLSTDYGAQQKIYGGRFHDYEPDYSHPYIEIDNNKCILCARCVRICREVVGANALGLVSRGFETYVAPSLGNSLLDTRCESCGLCISTCPTAAITENVPFKPAPVKWETVSTICNYCSIGCAINIHHKSQFALRVTGKQGLVNKDGNICRYPKFGYNYLNDKSRIIKPLLKKEGQFVEISFKKAFKLIAEKIRSVNSCENAFFGGARLSNEELYLIHKLAREAADTANAGSFHYLKEESGRAGHMDLWTPYEELNGASRIYLLGSEINSDNAVPGFAINKLRQVNGVPVELLTCKTESSMEKKVDKLWKLKSYYYFVKALNHYFLSNGMENGLFIKDNARGIEDYKKQLLEENFDQLLENSGFCCRKCFEEFAVQYNKEMNAILVFSEKEVSSNTINELINLAIISGKLGKTSMGLVSLKEKNNSQGLIDMGLFGDILSGKTIKNMFIFGEDPLGCAVDKKKAGKWFRQSDFIMVQDYFMSDTAEAADLVLPGSLPLETGGTYTNTWKTIQQYEKIFNPTVEYTGYEQLIALLSFFSEEKYESLEDVRTEMFSFIAKAVKEKDPELVYTQTDDGEKLFNHGCDSLVLRFDREFFQKITKLTEA